MSFHKLLVALDDSELSQTVFAQAVALAQATNAQLLLFSGIPDDLLLAPMPLSPELGALSPDLMNSTYQAQQANFASRAEALQTLLQHACEVAQAKGLQTETVFKPGNVEALLCTIAQEWGADLIVVGRRGRKGLSEALLGSVSNYAVHHAPCSVLVIQGEAETDVQPLLDQEAA